MNSKVAFALKASVYGTITICLVFSILVIALIEVQRRSTKSRIIRMLSAPITETCINALIHLATPKKLASELPVIRNPPKEYFPNVEKFRSAWKDIRDEALANLKVSKEIKGDRFFETIADSGWKRFLIKWYGPIDKDALRLAPKTCALVESSPEVKLAMFSILEPDSHISPHSGPYRGSLRYHLGLKTPNSDDCAITVEGDSGGVYSWKDGEDVLFDDTYRHFVDNDTNRQRIILFMDVSRPLEDGIVKTMRDYVDVTSAAATTRRNDINEVSTTGTSLTSPKIKRVTVEHSLKDPLPDPALALELSNIYA